jgi:hypothetical protein
VADREQPDQIQQLGLCGACDGLQITTLTRLPGVTDVVMDGPAGPGLLMGPAVVHVGPVPEDCPPEEARHG